MDIFEKAKSLIQDRGNQFVFKMVMVYASWKLIYYFLLPSAPIHFYWTQLVDKLGTCYAFLTNAFLKNIGERTLQTGNVIYFKDISSQISVGEQCLAIPAMYIFSFSILLFSGNLKNKLWFIPLGILSIALINISRLIVLAFIFAHYSNKYFMFHHRYSFVVLTYGLILVLVYIWMSSFSQPSAKTITD